MKYALTYLLFPVFISLTAAQEDFQQRADYIIEVILDDVRHQLRGATEITYYNNSPDTLLELYIHLYPNAYSSKSTAFARQMLRTGSKDFALAEPWELGSIDDLDFTTTAGPVPWSLTDDPDVAHVRLLEPLFPGQKLELRTKFTVQIPRSFSRFGRVGQSYQCTQWFPKIAVYDEHGWHQMPYLDQGEFYSNFGTYHVSLTVPENYIVAATGVLQDRAEQLWLNSLASAKNPPLKDFPQSAGSMKTLHFTAELVHDFAWFADKRFAVRMAEVEIDGRTVECRAFYTATDSVLWRNATSYLADAIRFYSEKIGPYPYPHMTAVQAPLSRGGGMEYPMITLIADEFSGFTLDQVLAHEVGHNWFYGILASNERDHPWIDEGMNSLYEYLYLLGKYYRRGDEIFPRFRPDSFLISDPQLYLQYMYKHGKLQSPALTSVAQTRDNYYLGAYIKPALAFWMLREYLGAEEFDDVMQAYYREWQFRHPGPGDIRKSFEEHSGRDLSWLFDGLLGSPELIDYRIEGFHRSMLSVRNEGVIVAPVQVLSYQDGRLIDAEWAEGFSGSTQLSVPAQADSVHLYHPAFTLDATPHNNAARITNGQIITTGPLKLTVLGRVCDPLRPHFNILPIAGWNDYDKVMAGVSLSNVQWPLSLITWNVAPMYATSSRSLTGMGEISARVIPRSQGIAFIQLTGVLKSFHYNRDFHYGFRDRYTKGGGEVRVRLSPRNPFDRRRVDLAYRGVFVHQHYGRGIDFENVIWERLTRSYFVNELSLDLQNHTALYNTDFGVRIHQGKGFLRLSADIEHKLNFRERDKGITFHAFAGWLPHFDNPDANVNFYYNGISSVGFSSKDFLYDHLILARNASSGFFSQQIFPKDAQLKTLYTGGISNEWMISAGIATDTPLPIPVQPYIDAVLQPDIFSEENELQFSYSGGLALVILRDVFEVYFPLFESSDIRNSLTYIDRKSVLQRASFTINLHKLNPRQLIEEALER